MIEAPAISHQPAEHRVLDHAALVREGVALLARMTDGRWTDFNAHDPGITLLELFCYGLTDVGYRIFHDVEDLLSEAGGDAREGLWSAADILTTRAVTRADMRRAVLDVEGVRNAWIEPAAAPLPIRYDPGTREIGVGPTAGEGPGEPIALIGLHRVLIEKSSLDLDDAALRAAVGRRLNAHRNLCEDFEAVTVLATQPVSVFADVEIGDTDRGDEVLLAIYRAIDAYISPVVPFRTLADMEAKNLPSETIFEGPEMAHGFLDTDEAGPRRRALQGSDVIRLLYEVRGVRAIRRVWLGGSQGASSETWSLPLRDDATPIFAVDLSEITLHNRVSVEVPVDRALVAERLAALRAAMQSSQPLPRSARDRAPPQGIDRHVGTYIPLQNDLPLVYGLAAGALPSSAPDARRAEADQLRAYLGLLDQILSDELALLADVPGLLASRNVGPNYPRGENPVLAEVPPLMAPGSQAEPDPTAAEAAAWHKSNRLADHLLARFGEEVPGGAAITAQDLVRVKQALLRRLPAFGAARGGGVDYLADPTPAASGLEQRVALRLGLDPDAGETLFVVEHILLRPIAEDQLQQLPFLSAANTTDPFSLQLSVVLRGDGGRLANPGFRRLVARTIQEETPAHIIPYLRWIDPEAGEPTWSDLSEAYRTWLSARRLWWTESGRGSG